MLLEIVLIIVVISLAALLILTLTGRFREKLNKWTGTAPKDEQVQVSAKKDAPTYVREIVLFFLIPGLKLMWEWKDAPEGSFQNTIWKLFLALSIAYGLWFILSLINNRINGPDVAPYSPESMESDEGVLVED